MRIIGYAYSAALHCPGCARQDQHMGRITWGGRSIADVMASKPDEHGIYDTAIDWEGEPVHPVFSTDEPGDTGDYCDDCLRDLRE